MALRVLLVDDDAGLLRLYDRFLRDGGFAVATCPDAESALQRLAAERFDILLVDILLPAMDGLSLVRHARQRAPGLACIVVTASESLHHAALACELGVIGYLLKPVDRVDLVAAVRRAAGKEPC